MSVVLSHRRTTELTHNIVFDRLFSHLAACDPLIPVTQYVLDLADEVRKSILSEVSMTYSLGLWGVIFENIRFHSAAKMPFCGAPLLHFLGELGAAAKDEFEIRLSPAQAIMALIQLQPEPALMTFHNDRTRGWCVRTTEVGIEKLGFSGVLYLNHDVPTFDTVQELFNILLKGHDPVMEIITGGA